MRPNGTLEDLGAVIGFSATIRLVSWYGGSTLNVPSEMRDAHPLNMIIGASAFKLLVEEWPGEAIKVPINAEYHESIRHRAVAALVAAGMVARDIGSVLYMTPRHVNRLRVEAEERGLLPKIMRESQKLASGRADLQEVRQNNLNPGTLKESTDHG